MLSRDRIMARIQLRGQELERRAEELERWVARGEGTAAAVQLALLADEAAFLRRLAAEYVERAELEAIGRRCERLAHELGVPW